MKVEIVNYSTDFYGGIYAILKENYDSEISRDNLENYYIDDNKNIYVAVLEGRIVGCAFLEIKNDYIRSRQYGFISYVAVSENYRKQGIGKQLVDYLRKIAKDKGCNTLELTSADYREGAHHFYESLGFTRKKTMVFIKEPI